MMWQQIVLGNGELELVMQSNLTQNQHEYYVQSYEQICRRNPDARVAVCLGCDTVRPDISKNVT